MFKWAQRIARFLIVLVTSVFLVFSAITAWFAFGFHNADRLVQPELAFWMSHDWSTSQRGDYLTLANQLDDFPPTSLYFHVGPIAADGSLAMDLEIVPSLLDALPSTNYAWIGQIRSEIDLDDPAVRASIVSSADWLLAQGFDGLHVNVEPVRKDDLGFMFLMKELDTAFPETSISIAMDEWQPDLITNLIARWFNAVSVSYWPSDQVTALMPYVDEFVVMTYDTGFHDPGFYSWWVEQQTVALSKLMDGETRLLIGLPVYESGSNIDPETENLESGLVGYARGLSNVRSNADAIDGVAIYPYWEMDELEWQILNSYLNETHLR